MNSCKKIAYVLVLFALLLGTGCKKLLEEQPRSELVPTYFNTPAGLLGAIAGVYNDIRGAWGTEGFTIMQMSGTDEHLMGGSAAAPQFFTYNGIQPSQFDNGFWNTFYQDINTLNGVFHYAPDVDLPSATKQQYLAQAKFLRGFLYFYLVQTFGSVPLHTTFITVPSQADSKAPVEEVYTQIIKDLTEASAELDDKPTAPFLGKAATKPAAIYLLAKVYLTRGWLTNAAADFTQAFTIASGLIANRATYGVDMWADYADAFRPANDYGKETLFVSDHSNDAKFGQYVLGASGGASQNLTPWFHRFNYPATIGINSDVDAGGVLRTAGPNMLFRDVAYGRPYTRIRPNVLKLPAGPNAGKNYIYDQAFADRVNDSRYDKTFQTVWIANMNASGQASYSGAGVGGTRGTLICGSDTAVWFPDHEIAGAPQNDGARPFKGIIIPPSLQSSIYFPAVKKFDDLSRVGPNDPSTRPVVIFRFSDVYLVAAEAALKGGGTMDQAAEMLNAVRKRAAFRISYPPGVTQASAEAAVTIAAADVTLDFILDERTREFYSETQRWWDLVRTKSLLTRIAMWNPVEAGTNIQAFHALRPIPQQQIDRVTQGSCVGNPCWQNPGY